MARKPSIRPGAEVVLTAERVDEAGFGVADAAGVAVHAANWLPGEHALVEIEHRSGQHPRAWGRVSQMRGAPSASRAVPLCPGFGRCGGCAWQHMAYAAQLAHKEERVVAALREVGLTSPAAAIRPAAAVSGYRNVGKYVAGRGEGGLILGAYEPRTHRVVDTAGCCVVESVIDRVRGHVRDVCAGAALPIPIYDERARTGVLRYVVIRSGADGRVVVALVTSAEAEGAVVESIARAISGHADVAGVVWVKNPETGGVVIAGEIVPLVGESAVVERVAGVTILVGVGDFFQVNRAQALALYARVAELAGPSERAVDLYSGVGGIAFSLAAVAAGRRVVGVEVSEEAVAAASAAAERAGLADRVRFMAGRAGDLAGVCAAEGAGVVVVNPPRKGLDEATRRALIQAGAAQVIYVSCGPESLARDLRELCNSGYEITSVEPFDLMPGTGQVETVVSLMRGSGNGR